MKYLLLVAINLRRKKLRTVLTLLSILVAFLLYGYLGAIEVALGQGVEVAGADRLVVRHRVSIVQPLPLSYGARISRLAGVEDAMHASWFGGVYQDPRNFFAQIPVEPDRFQAMYPEYV
nr:ABC transporter permease [Verrucomicrobiota bacterium]